MMMMINSFLIKH